MNDETRPNERLTRALRAMADDDRRIGASADVGLRLLAEAHTLARGRRIRVYAAVGAIAVVVLAAILMPGWRWSALQPAAVEPAGAAAPTPGEVVTDFYPLMYVNVPTTDPQTIRLELPQAALSSFGLEPYGTSPTVVADVVVGQDGLARAVRFVRPSDASTRR